MHFASTILMVRPAAFGYNEQTAIDNAFQANATVMDLPQNALVEFDAMVQTLRFAGIEVITVDDTAEPLKPDAIFPNNWFCTLPGGEICLFPMYANNRRVERRTDIIDWLKEEFICTALQDWSAQEDHHLFLESTGSMIFDHQHKLAYASLSERTSPELFQQFAKKAGYHPIPFNAVDKKGYPIYHTNVLMCIGNSFCIICDEIIAAADKERVLTTLIATGKEIISISFQQLKSFAGNMLQLSNKNGEHCLIMSEAAHNSLTPQQVERLSQYSKLVIVNIPSIEAVGGGSARCMMAEIFLQRR